MAVYEKDNKVFVTDDNSQKLFIIDGITHKTITTLNVGGAASEMVVNETYGKVYVASDLACCTTGITPGTGLISIIDAHTNRIN